MKKIITITIFLLSFTNNAFSQKVKVRDVVLKCYLSEGIAKQTPNTTENRIIETLTWIDIFNKAVEKEFPDDLFEGNPPVLEITPHMSLFENKEYYQREMSEREFLNLYQKIGFDKIKK